MDTPSTEACYAQAAREHPDPVLTDREKLALLMFYAYEGHAASEGVLAHAVTGGDRIAARILRGEGEDVDARLRDARIARATAYARLVRERESPVSSPTAAPAGGLGGSNTEDENDEQGDDPRTRDGASREPRADRGS